MVRSLNGLTLRRPAWVESQVLARPRFPGRAAILFVQAGGECGARGNGEEAGYSDFLLASPSSLPYAPAWGQTRASVSTGRVAHSTVTSSHDFLSKGQSVRIANWALLATVLAAASASDAEAAMINFTGGTVHLVGGGTATTNNSSGYVNVDYYEQGGYRFDYIGNPSDDYIGNYYGNGDVMHWHFDGARELRVSKIDGGLFDLNSFRLTSNTISGGGNANGTENTFLNASYDGLTVASSLRLPSENWGGTAALITPGALYTGLKYFSIVGVSNVYCIGIDDVNVQDASPTPEPASMALLAMGGGLLAFGRKRLSRRRQSAEVLA
jgi:hypothetical protein